MPLLPSIWLPKIGAGGLVLLCLIVRLVALDADPPSWLSWSTGLYTDEGFYTLDARSEALFGTTAPGNFHDSLLSPLLSLIQQGIFTVFGTGLLQARLFSVVFGLLTVALFWLGLRRAYGARTADLGALFLGLAPTFVFYNRLALQETPTVFWLALAFALWAYGKFASGAALAVAIIFKSLAVVALPVLLIAPPAPNNGGAGRGDRPRSVTSLAPPLLGAGGILLLYFFVWYWPHHTELARMANYYRFHQMQPHSALSLWLNVRRGLIGGERGVIPYLLAFLPVPCLLAGWKLSKWRVWTQADCYLAIWLGCGLTFCLLSSYAPSRYYVLFLPPLAGLAARCLVEWKRSVQITAIFAFCVVSLAWYGAAWVGRTDTRRDASQTLVRLLPPGSVVIGEFAPSLCLDTPFAAAPVQPGLSNDDHPVERLHATDIAVTRTAFWQAWWEQRYPGIVVPSHKIATVSLGGSRRYIIDVYAVRN
ncbi:MAG: ArnT family glycosyltransferase [Janthinobacterium lividum]